jgi:hypothetical protein
MSMLKKSFALALLLGAAPTVASDWSADLETERSARQAAKARDVHPGNGPLVGADATRGEAAAAGSQHTAMRPGECPCRCVPAHDHRDQGQGSKHEPLPDYTSGG